MVKLLNAAKNEKLNRSLMNLIYVKYDERLTKIIQIMVSKYKDLDPSDFCKLKFLALKTSLEIWDNETGEKGFEKLVNNILTLKIKEQCRCFTHKEKKWNIKTLYFDNMNEERREYLISNNEPDPMEEFLVCEENEAKMERVLDILPKKYHEITNLKYIGYKNREIRKKLNIDDKKLRSKIVSIKKFVENYY